MGVVVGGKVALKHVLLPEVGLLVAGWLLGWGVGRLVVGEIGGVDFQVALAAIREIAALVLPPRVRWQRMPKQLLRTRAVVLPVDAGEGELPALLANPVDLLGLEAELASAGLFPAGSLLHDNFITVVPRSITLRQKGVLHP